MIYKFDIRQNYYNQAVRITLTNGVVLDGVIIDDMADYCMFVKNLKLIKYNKTKDKSLVERIYFKDMKSVDYQRSKIRL